MGQKEIKQILLPQRPPGRRWAWLVAGTCLGLPVSEGTCWSSHNADKGARSVPGRWGLAVLQGSWALQVTRCQQRVTLLTPQWLAALDPFWMTRAKTPTPQDGQMARLLYPPHIWSICSKYTRWTSNLIQINRTWLNGPSLKQQMYSKRQKLFTSF